MTPDDTSGGSCQTSPYAAGRSLPVHESSRLRSFQMVFVAVRVIGLARKSRDL